MRDNTRKGLQRLAIVRLEEAETLFDNGYYWGAYYLAGYAVECALKACLAKKIQRHDFPNKAAVDNAWCHNLDRLLTQAGLTTAKDADPEVAVRWGELKDWSEHSRYDRSQKKSDAQGLLDAIRDPRHGVLIWLKAYW